jgi:hypothetical protein
LPFLSSSEGSRRSRLTVGVVIKAVQYPGWVLPLGVTNVLTQALGRLEFLRPKTQDRRLRQRHKKPQGKEEANLLTHGITEKSEVPGKLK